nr:RNA polymerase sigma-70 factor [uncultured Flavobacterium sp.]
MFTKFSDEELVVMLQEGRTKAFDELYIRYRDLLVNYVYRRVKSVSIAEEIVQEVFITIWERRKVLVIQRKFASYMYTSVRYATLDYFKSNTIKDDFIDEVVNSYEESPKTNSIEEYIFFEELQEALNNATLLLPTKAQEVFVLSRYKNYTNKEISEELKISIETVKYHINYALKLMRTNLKEFYFLIALLFFRC